MKKTSPSSQGSAIEMKFSLIDLSCADEMTWTRICMDRGIMQVER